jgi:hypothetical protein
MDVASDDKGPIGGGTGTAVPTKYTRAGKIRLLTLADLDKRTVAYRLVKRRIQAIIDEEFDGEVTIRQRTAIQNDVLLGMFSENLIVQQLSGHPRSPRRLAELISCQRNERKSRNE